MLRIAERKLIDTLWNNSLRLFFILSITLHILGIVKQQLQNLNCAAGNRAALLVIGAFITTAISTWGAFKIFPANPDAANVITVFAGIFGVIAGIIGLYKLLK